MTSENKSEDAINQKIIQEKRRKINEEFNILRDLAGNLRGELEFLRDSFKKSYNRYKEKLKTYKDDLKKEHEKSNKKQSFSYSGKDKRLFKNITRLMYFSRGFVKVYDNWDFEAVFHTPDNFFKFFFFEWELRKARDYDLLKECLRAISRLNDNLPHDWKVNKDIIDSINRVRGQYLPTLNRKIIEFRNIREEIRKVQKGLKKNE